MEGIGEFLCLQFRFHQDYGVENERNDYRRKLYQAFMSLVNAACRYLIVSQLSNARDWICGI